MIKLANITETRVIQWLRKTTMPQKIALGAGAVVVIGILSFGGYTVFGNQTDNTTPITQTQPAVKVGEVPATTTPAPVVAEAVAPVVATPVAIEPSPGVESNATTYEVTSTEGEDYYVTDEGARTEYVEEETYYEPAPSYSEPEPTYSAPEPTYTAPAAAPVYDEWADLPQADSSGTGGGGFQNN